MKLNEVWHRKNVLGQNAPVAKRIDWHLRHKENCACRDIPKSIANIIEGKKIKICSRGHRFIDAGSCPICWPGKGKSHKTLQ